MTFYRAKSITLMYFSTLPWLKKNQNKTYTKNHANSIISASNIGLQMPFRFSSPATKALRSQKFYSDSKNNSFITSVFFSTKDNSFQDIAYVKSKVDGEKVVLKTRGPILQMLYD